MNGSGRSTVLGVALLAAGVAAAAERAADPLPWDAMAARIAGALQVARGEVRATDVRLEIERGGAVRGATVRWLFFPDATVRAADATVVEQGRLVE